MASSKESWEMFSEHIKTSWSPVFRSQNYNPAFPSQNYYSQSSLEWMSISLCLSLCWKDAVWIWIWKILPQNQITVYCLYLLLLHLFTLLWALFPLSCMFIFQNASHTHIMGSEIYTVHKHSSPWLRGPVSSTNTLGHHLRPTVQQGDHCWDILPRMGDYPIGSLIFSAGRQPERSECYSFRLASINKIPMIMQESHSAPSSKRVCGQCTCTRGIVTMAIPLVYITLFNFINIYNFI